jgi:hypothetical protein
MESKQDNFEAKEFFVRFRDHGTSRAIVDAFPDVARVLNQGCAPPAGAPPMPNALEKSRVKRRQLIGNG